MKKAQTYIGKVVLGLAVIAGLSSCGGDPQSPGIEYMPDMYRSPSYETYIKKLDLDSAAFYERFTNERGLDKADIDALYAVWKDGRTQLKPVEGTVPRGFMPFAYSKDEYEKAGAELKNPVAYSKDVLKEGEELYNIFCDHCHGAKGEADGAMVRNDKFPPPPSYKTALKDLPEGKIFFTMHYGKGLMGSHASQLTQEERWKIVYYVQKLQGKELGAVQNVAPVVVDTADVDSTVISK